jgi:(p)ppGpp synthase/HD superfamily hydrolase
MTHTEKKLREAIRAQIRKYLKEADEPDYIKKAKGATKTALKKFDSDAEFGKLTPPQKVEFIVAMIKKVGLDSSTKQKLQKVLPSLVESAKRYKSKLREEKEKIPALPTEEDGRVDVNQLFSILGKSVLGKRFARLGSKPDAARAEAIVKFAKMIGVPTSKISDIVTGLLAQQGEEEPIEEPIDDMPMDDIPEEPIEEPIEEPEEEELPED